MPWDTWLQTLEPVPFMPSIPSLVPWSQESYLLSLFHLHPSMHSMGLNQAVVMGQECADITGRW